MPTEGLEPRDTWRALGSTLADVIDAALTPFCLLTPDFRFVSANRAYCAIVGRSVDQMVGREVFEAFPESVHGGDGDAPGLRQSLEMVVDTGCPHSMPLLRYDLADEEGGRPVERYWHVTNVPLLDDDGRVRLILNHPEEVTDYVDERMRLEAVGGGSIDATSSASKLSAVDSAFTAAISRLQNLNDLASALVGATDDDAIGAAVLSDGLAMAGAVGGALVIVDGDHARIVTHTGIDAATTEHWTEFVVRSGSDPFSDALVDGMPRLYPDREAMLGEYPTVAVELERNSHEAWAVLPLRVGDRVIGAIGLTYADRHPFSPALRLVLYTLASLVAQATARSQLIEEQSVAMRSIEQAFRANLDPIPGVEVSDLYRPASTATNAGGDWYEIIGIAESRTLVAIGDVANHGAVAVGEMARTRATVHALALQGLSPGRIATQADRVLTRVSATFTTSIVAIYDADRRRLEWTTAGHPPPVLRRADGTAEFVAETHGAPLGAGMAQGYTSSTLDLDVGDTLVLYTDGLVERSDEAIDVGLERLRGLVERTPPSPTMAADLFAALVGEHHPDDIAVLTLHVTG